MGVIPSVITAPNPGRTFIEREAITRLTSQVADSRLTIVNAPAGSGKTFAARHWFETITGDGDRPGLWISVRAGVRSLATFRTALKEAGLAAGLPWDSLDPEGDPETWLTGLATPVECRPLIVVEDAQLLPPDAVAFLGQWITGARDTITTIIVSRGAIGIPITRMRALGLLVEVGFDELRFNPAEANELLFSILEAPADRETIHQVISEMGGWASGLVMAGEHLRTRTARKFAGSLGLTEALYADLTAYFQEEILDTQDPLIRRFVTETSVLETLTPSACAAVQGDENARQMLEVAHQLGLFIEKIETEKAGYSYHPLFRRLILDAMEYRAPALAAECHRRASRYYASTGEERLAVEHARRSRDPDFLAEQLDQLSNALIYKGFLYFVDEQAAELPWALISTRPMLLLALAWRRTRRLSLVTAERYISAAQEIAEQRPHDHMLAYLLRHRQILLKFVQDDLRFVEVEAEKLLLELGDEEPYLCCTLVGHLMSTRRELFHFQDILKLEAETRRALERPGSEFASITLKATVAPTLLVLGKADMAHRLLDEALDHAESRCGIGSSVAAVPALMLAETLYDTGELNRADELVEQYLPVVRQWGMVDELAAGFITRARLAFARGDVNRALAVLEEVHLIAIECGLDRLRALVVCEQVRILIRSGRVAAAEDALRAGDIMVEEVPVPTLTPTRKNETIAIAWLRIEIQRHRLARAKKVASRWLEFVTRNSAKRSIVTFQLLLAEIALLEGDRGRARRAVRGAIEAAEPSGWVSIFLDEGDSIRSLLAEAYGSGHGADTAADRFAVRIVGLLSGVPDLQIDEQELAPVSQLIDREIEILTMVGGGLQNREIGDRLGLTEGTVKWYLQQVYDKLGVRRRSQAVLRARQLGVFG